MNAPTMTATVLAVTEKQGRTNFLSVFVSSGNNILINATDPAYNYVKKGMQLTFTFDKIVSDTYPDGKAFVKFVGVKVTDIQEGNKQEVNNPFAHLAPRVSDNCNATEERHLKLVARI